MREGREREREREGGGGGRERDRGEGKRERERERERESRYLCFQVIFFGPLLFTCDGAFMGAERGGDGERFLPPVENIGGASLP